MKFVFLNPSGAWAFLGVPALVLIHCLRVKAREIRIPAIFLVERRDEAAPGRKFARWRSSPLFWIQLLAILLLAALLMQPRVVKPDSRREVALVVDASVSMRAFPKETLAAASKLADRLGRDVALTHWLLMSTDAGTPPLYVGDDRAAMLAALEKFSPELGAHDFTEALLAARRGVARGGRVVLLTDHDLPETPAGAELVAVGSPIANAGFSGGECTPAGRWRAMVANPSAVPVARRWWLEYGEGLKTAAADLTLPAGGTITLSGAAPAERFTVVLDPDAFTPDDRLPLVTPRPKPLVWRSTLPQGIAEIVNPAMASLDNARPGADADIELLAVKTRDIRTKATKARILFPDTHGAKTAPAKEPCYAPAKHPLTDGLAWGLVPAFADTALETSPDDVVLVRAGDRPVVRLGRSGGMPELIFDYDPRDVFAGARSPAVAVLIRRFAESVRAAKDAPESLNTDCRAPLPTPPGTAPLTLKTGPGTPAAVPENATLRAPGLPGFFEVSRGGAIRITGAAAFADAREADFTTASSVVKLAAPDANNVRGEAEIDPLTLAGLLLLLALALVAWRLSASRHAE